MSQNGLQTLEKLKIIYYEIVAGCSYVANLDIYIKHFSDLDNIEITRTKNNLLNQYIKDGIPSYKDRIAFLKEQGEWLDKDEENITFLKTLIHDNEKNLKTIIAQQQGAILQVIKDKRLELTSALIKKRNLVGSTAEEFAERDTINYMAYRGIFKDPFCNERLFKSLEDFQNLEDEKLDLYTDSMDLALNDLNEENIRKIAAMPFFINIFSYVKDDVSTFFKKPMTELSNYQFLLISLGSRNLGILSATEGEPPEIITDNDIQQRVDFFDKEYSVLLGKRKPTK